VQTPYCGGLKSFNWSMSVIAILKVTKNDEKLWLIFLLLSRKKVSVKLLLHAFKTITCSQITFTLAPSCQ